MLVVLVYISATIYFTLQDFGILYSLFFAIPTTPLVLIFGSLATGAITGLIKGILNWLRK
jgi:hypothetical protein